MQRSRFVASFTRPRAGSISLQRQSRLLPHHGSVMENAKSLHSSAGCITPLLYDQFILFGASILEHSSTQERGFALAPALQQGIHLFFDELTVASIVDPHSISRAPVMSRSKTDGYLAYIRRLDVVNRGFSGFNTEQGLRVLPKIIPNPAQARAVLFGSNDACFAETQNGQHVPLDQYKKNLFDIVNHPAVKAQNTRVILVTPPPVEERRLEHRVKSQGYTELNRSNERTKQYADASREVAQALDVGCLDLWTAFMSKAGWKPGGPLYGSRDLPENTAIRSLIHDGLHFTPEAYAIFYEELMKVIASKWPDQLPEALPYVIPAWDDTAAWAKEGLRMGKANVVRHE